MKKTVTVEVLRPQIGDKRYERGDRRELPPAVAEKFVATGAVRIIKSAAKSSGKAPNKPKAKRAAAPSNKAAPAPANKAEGGPAAPAAPPAE